MAAYDIRRKWQITLNEYLSPLLRLQCKFKKYANILQTVTYSFLFNNHLNSYLVHIQCSLSLIKYFNNYQHSWQDLIKCFLPQNLSAKREKKKKREKETKIVVAKYLISKGSDLQKEGITKNTIE